MRRFSSDTLMNHEFHIKLVFHKNILNVENLTLNREDPDELNGNAQLYTAVTGCALLNSKYQYKLRSWMVHPTSDNWYSQPSRPTALSAYQCLITVDLICKICLAKM